VTCDPPTLFKGNPWYAVPARRFHMKVVVGEPIASASFRREDELPARAARRLTQALLSYYGATEGARQGCDVQPVNSGAAPTPMASVLS
jgi:hypothetical protein